MSVFEKLFATRKAATVAAATNWDSLVQRVADESLQDPGEVDAVLTALGRSLEELQTAVRRIHDRQTWQTMVDELPSLQEASNSIEAAMKSAQVEYALEVQAAASRHQVALLELQRQSSVVATRIGMANEAGTDLHKSKAPEVRAAELATSLKIRRLMGELDAIESAMATERDLKYHPMGYKPTGTAYDQHAARASQLRAEIEILRVAS